MRVDPRDALSRYRVLANVVGVVLIVLVFVAVPIRYVFGHPTFSKTLSPVHGFLYLTLVVNVYLLGKERGWTAKHTVLVALGGTVPVLSFVVERRVARAEADRQVEPAAA